MELCEAEVYHGPPADVLESKFGNSPVRFVCIEIFDLTPCCGTHVKSLREIQVIYLWKSELLPDGKYRLSLFTGLEKLVNKMSRLLHADTNLQSILKAPLDDFAKHARDVLHISSLQKKNC